MLSKDKETSPRPASPARSDGRKPRDAISRGVLECALVCAIWNVQMVRRYEGGEENYAKLREIGRIESLSTLIFLLYFKIFHFCICVL